MVKVKINDREYTIVKKNDKYLLGQEELHIDLYKRRENEFHILYNDISLSANILSFDPLSKEIEVEIKGKTFKTKLVNDLDAMIEKLKSATASDALHQKLTSPMPGMVQKIFIKEGDDIAAGESLVILNAMKMENILKSPVDGKVTKIEVSEGEQVEKGRVLIQF